MKAAYDVEVEWRAFEIHPETPPEGVKRNEAQLARRRENYARMRERALEFGREMVLPEWGCNSHRALEAVEYAREQGVHERFHEAVFSRLFRDNRNVHEWEVLRDAAVEAGLDPDEMQQKTESGIYGAAVNAQTSEAQSLGITGVPTFVFDDRYAIVGAQPFEAFHRVMESLGQKPRSDT